MFVDEIDLSALANMANYCHLAIIACLDRATLTAVVSSGALRQIKLWLGLWRRVASTGQVSRTFQDRDYLIAWGRQRARLDRYRMLGCCLQLLELHLEFQVRLSGRAATATAGVISELPPHGSLRVGFFRKQH
jgi:hypothetical protein